MTLYLAVQEAAKRRIERGEALLRSLSRSLALSLSRSLALSLSRSLALSLSLSLALARSLVSLSLSPPALILACICMPPATVHCLQCDRDR